MAAEFFGRANSTDDSEPGMRLTLPQVRSFLTRYRWVIAGVFACTVLTAYAALNLMTELYDVQSALMVKMGRENLNPPATARNAVLSTGVRREELGSEVQILRSPVLLAQVVDEIGVEAFRVRRVPPPDLLGKVKFYTKAGLRWVKSQYQEALIALDLRKRLSEREAAIDMLTQRLTAEPQKNSDVILLGLRIADPALGVRVQQTLVEKYLAQRIKVRQNPGVQEFFEKEVADLRQALEAAEMQVNAWKGERGLTIPAEQKSLLLRQIRELSALRERTASRHQALSTQVATARTLAGGAAERVKASQVERPSVAAQQVRERLAKLQTERVRLLTTYETGAAPVKTVEEEIATLTQLLQREGETEVGSVTTEINPSRQLLEQTMNQDTVALEGLTAELRTQGQQLARLQAELRQVDRSDATFVELERERALTEGKYLEAVKRLNDAETESQLDLSRVSNVSVAVPPAATLQPVYPRKLLIMLAALAVGLVLGVALAIALEWSNESIRDAEDVAASSELVCLASFTADRRSRRLSGAA